eukprot:TRINITY_DN321_c0_g1_i1.p1 TRINITY_DN321_c0_g1~~TRINITY_DN321_c0_g1_i1.p1  ORF type:complete len:310 (-),score=121.30 TRINITY_DN321_c0_g1_i1:477-1406(-)
MKTTIIVLIALLFASCVVAVEESTNAQEQINVEQSNESLSSDASEDSEDAEDEVDAVEDEADESDATDDSDDSDDSEQESAVEDDSEDSEDSDDSENDEDSDDDSDDEESLEDSSEEEEQVNQNFGPINAVVANMSAEDRQKHSDEIQKLLAEEEAERKELLAKNELTDEDLRWRFRWRKACKHSGGKGKKQKKKKTFWRRRSSSNDTEFGALNSSYCPKDPAKLKEVAKQYKNCIRSGMRSPSGTSRYSRSGRSQCNRVVTSYRKAQTLYGACQYTCSSLRDEDSDVSEEAYVKDSDQDYGWLCWWWR